MVLIELFQDSAAGILEAAGNRVQPAAGGPAVAGRAPIVLQQGATGKEKWADVVLNSFAFTDKWLVPGFKALLLLILAWIVSGWLARIVERWCERAELEPTLARFFASFVRYSMIVAALIACVSLFGINPTGFAAVLGSAGIAIGLALQGSLSHVASGVMLLISRPFKVGDLVVIAGQTGRVDAVTLFFTTLDTADHRRIIIPNGQAFGSIIQNMTHHEHRRIEVPVKTDAGFDPDKARHAMLAAANTVQGGLPDRAPEVLLTSIAGPAEWTVALWCNTKDADKVRERLMLALFETVDRRGMGPRPAVQRVQQIA